ncbi:hypothetical protein M3Y97_00330100 [Aphelenchoides bicaudatus]|nr:hypothetical protein M3Y97_00330100 [Aphelenchoides bicaudatus]
MVEILDETPALNDPLFLEIWDRINLKKQLEEAHRQLSIATSMPDTVQKTYLVLIDNYRKELEEWFLEEPDESYYQDLYKEIEQINAEIENCRDALQSIELYKKFEERTEQSYAKHWDGLERRTRELVRILTKFLLEGSEKMLEMNKEIKHCEENYESLRFGIRTLGRRADCRKND